MLVVVEVVVGGAETMEEFGPLLKTTATTTMPLTTRAAIQARTVISCLQLALRAGGSGRAGGTSASGCGGVTAYGTGDERLGCTGKRKVVSPLTSGDDTT